MFQGLMNDIIRQHQLGRFAFVYLDDVVIGGYSEKDLIEKLNNVFHAFLFVQMNMMDSIIFRNTNRTCINLVIEIYFKMMFPDCESKKYIGNEYTRLGYGHFYIRNHKTDPIK